MGDQLHENGEREEPKKIGETQEKEKNPYSEWIKKYRVSVRNLLEKEDDLKSVGIQDDSLLSEKKTAHIEAVKRVLNLLPPGYEELTQYSNYKTMHYADNLIIQCDGGTTIEIQIDEANLKYPLKVEYIKPQFEAAVQFSASLERLLPSSEYIVYPCPKDGGSYVFSSKAKVGINVSKGPYVGSSNNSAAHPDSSYYIEGVQLDTDNPERLASTIKYVLNALVEVQTLSRPEKDHKADPFYRRAGLLNGNDTWISYASENLLPDPSVNADELGDINREKLVKILNKVWQRPSFQKQIVEHKRELGIID